jgi:hypothetical protein
LIYPAVVMERDAAKLLVVTEDGLPSELTAYALKVAMRLDLDIFVLFVTEAGAHVSVEQRKKLIERYKQQIEQDAASFTTRAWRSGVRVTVVVDAGRQDEAIARIRAQEPAIRFILSEDAGTDTNNAALPRITVVEQPW